MKENNQNELNENDNKNININDETEEILDDKSDDISPEPEYVTREINLDDLYDGAINNTIVIDPVTNNEVLLSNKKPNYTIIGVIIAIIILLVLYYVNNKSDLGRTTKNVAPKTTAAKNITEATKNETGTLTCTYSSKSDAENQSVTFVANYENYNITTTNFNYVVMSNIDNLSAVVEDLRTQYENFFINNASVEGSNISYEKNDKGFTFNVETDYKKADFAGIITSDGQTILYVKPSNDDSVKSLQNAYVEKGFSCNLTNSLNEE